MDATELDQYWTRVFYRFMVESLVVTLHHLASLGYGFVLDRGEGASYLRTIHGGDRLGEEDLLIVARACRDCLPRFTDKAAR